MVPSMESGAKATTSDLPNTRPLFLRQLSALRRSGVRPGPQFEQHEFREVEYFLALVSGK